MKPTYNIAFWLNFVFYIIKSLVIVTVWLHLGIYPTVAVIGFAVFAVFTSALIYVYGKIRTNHQWFFKVMLSFLSVVVDLFVGFAFDSAQVMIYSMMLSSITILTFIDDRLMKTHAVQTYFYQVLCLVLLFLIKGSSKSALEMNFGIIANAVANWVCVGIINRIIIQDRQAAEQEQSLDDLLTLVESKCDEARVATKSKTAFLAVMSHEIRTPINAVMGMTETILRDSKEETTIEYAEDIKTASESLLSIVNDILDITKLEESKLKIIPVNYHITSVITDVYNLVKFRTETRQLDLVFDIDENLPTELYGDDVRIKQVITNLLTNAVKYTESGTITFTAKRESEDTFLFSVKDTGIGIKPEDMNVLFDSFARMDEKKNHYVEGSGLGLSITAALLKLLHSELKVKSEYGQGSEFYFTIRQKVVDNTPIGNYQPFIRNQIRKSHTLSYVTPDAHVLLVDDNAINRKVFINLLKPMQIQITEAASGKECLELVKSNRYDIVFMDHMMPEMDGLETFDRMKKMDDNMSKDAPVVMLTANAIAGAKEAYLSAGFTSMLTKPINPTKLEKKILSLLPPTCIKTAESEVVAEEERPSVNTAKLAETFPMINGVDWRIAKLNIESDETIISTIKMFVSSLSADADELNSYYQQIAEKENVGEALKSYRIKVHSMKSSALLIGIVFLAGMAMRLELAASEEDADTILAMHSTFIDSWLSFHSPLSAFVKPAGETKNAGENADEIKQIFEDIKTAAAVLDVDALDELSARLDTFSFEGEMAEKVEDVKNAIFNFDTDKLKNISV